MDRSAAALEVGAGAATSPAVESTGRGDVRAWYAETVRRNALERLEHLVPVVVGRRPVVERAGEALGCEHGGRIQVGGRIPEIYGDYGEMAITSAGRTIAVWGEGFSWTGPGGAWFNRQS